MNKLLLYIVAVVAMGEFQFGFDSEVIPRYEKTIQCVNFSTGKADVS